jgi:hypothetical protein
MCTLYRGKLAIVFSCSISSNAGSVSETKTADPFPSLPPTPNKKHKEKGENILLWLTPILGHVFIKRYSDMELTCL